MLSSQQELTCGCVSACGTRCAVRAWMVVVVEVVLIARRLSTGLVPLGKGMRGRVRAWMLLLWRLVRLSVMLLVNYTRGSRVLQVLGRRMTLLLVLWMMLHREKTH